MRIDEQQNAARVLERCRLSLERLRAQLGTSHDAAEPLQSVADRVLDVQNALVTDVQRRRRRTPSALWGQWTTPRLGVLRQTPPEPLRVPTRYLRTDPPDPAPAIALVTPSFQQGAFLERTILSVLDQNYPALQYVVQDGGSSDQTLAVLRRHEGRLRCWTSQPDGGQADAINRGFAHTTGEIMAYLNSDDLLLPGALAYVARYFAAHPDIEVVYGHRVLIDEHDRQIGSWVLPPHDDRLLDFIDFIPQETLFWRRRAWEKAGGAMDTSFRFALDWDLLQRLRAAGAEMVRLPRFLGAFRIHDEQKTAVERDICGTESERLTRRALGRSASPEEVIARSRPFLRRHLVYHTLHRARIRMPGERSDVRTRTAAPSDGLPPGL